ncbi:leader peptidase (prepilin peptidase) / N-methyltransferase [Actinokineospora alba]|uniref:Leader peptidase (Prepilin peptidase) / N-methyltransferase n=1 Tax=Actinokineospora alba TaxID=504798 RepID=A0A1H0TLZ1_9PSEU|nr:A24 family peptidase [Actinokineospora alba]TDP70579.1 leader peptidase (prepilin peptidase)/N-methyltransferase [Actinokineospora alba]SDJ10871.1 leader peptidase (prepilin peptidase) / N-methyltransferase [Actinokineospora alba]SDP54658.1 leader peptidase (prepilin peptidase) / N-methyltransferase [Actinokineospora alba]
MPSLTSHAHTQDLCQHSSRRTPSSPGRLRRTRLLLPLASLAVLALALAASRATPGFRHWLIITATTIAGAAAGALIRWLLARIPRGTTVKPGICEFTIALLWSLIAYQWTTGHIAPGWLPSAFLFTCFATALTMTDLHHRRLPNALTIPAYPITAACITVAALSTDNPATLWQAATGATLFLTLHAAVHLLRPTALGAGDVKLSGPLGAILGAVHLAALPIAAVLAAGVTVLLATATPRDVRSRWQSGIPHGPGLLAATTLFVIFGGAPLTSL